VCGAGRPGKVIPSRTVGVIGGMGPLATAAFFREIVRATKAATDQDHLHVIVDSDSSIPDRTGFLLGAGPDPRPALIASARRLRAAGCELLAMPCNTAHAFGAEIRAAVDVPLLDWIAITADAIAAAGRAPVGLLATRGTLRVGLYQRALAARGVESVVPRSSEALAVMAAIYGREGVKGGAASERSQRLLLRVARQLVERGARRLILACTELPLAVPATDPRWPVPAVDPAVVNARELVRLAGGRLAQMTGSFQRAGTRRAETNSSG